MVYIFYPMYTCLHLYGSESYRGIENDAVSSFMPIDFEQAYKFTFWALIILGRAFFEVGDREVLPIYSDVVKHRCL